MARGSFDELKILTKISPLYHFNEDLLQGKNQQGTIC